MGDRPKGMPIDWCHGSEACSCPKRDVARPPAQNPGANAVEPNAPPMPVSLNYPPAPVVPEEKSPEKGADLEQAKECVVCMAEDAKDHAVVPCYHVCLCKKCATEILEGPKKDRKCPLCRQPADNIIRVYL